MEPGPFPRDIDFAIVCHRLHHLELRVLMSTRCMSKGAALHMYGNRTNRRLWLVASLQTEIPASQADLDDPRYAKLRYHPGGLRAILTASTLKARVGQPLCMCASCVADPI